MSGLFPPPGGNAAGPRFLGFEAEIEVASRHLLDPREPVNLAVVGLPGAGKSSLISEALGRCSGELRELDRVVVHINSSQFQSPRQCFGLIALQVATALRNRSRGAIDLSPLAHSLAANQGEFGWSVFYIDVCDFFARVRDAELQVILVLEEFDQIRTVFTGSVEGFGLLLELSSSPRFEIGLVTVSRRTPFEIETMTGAISNLAPVLPLLVLQLRRVDFTEAVAGRLHDQDRTVDAKWAAEVHEISAGHPYLVTLFAHEASVAATGGHSTSPGSLVDAVWPRASELRIRMNQFSLSVRGQDLDSGMEPGAAGSGALSRFDQLTRFSASLRKFEAVRFDGVSLRDTERAGADGFAPANQGVVVMGSQFNIQNAQAGSIGDNASASGNSLLQNNIANVAGPLDLAALAREIAVLRAVATNDGSTRVSPSALAELEAAEVAAIDGDEAGVLDRLARTGKWIVSKSEAIGLAVLVEAVKRVVFS